MASQPLTIAWISEYPIEWMADLPEALRGLPKQHPATWMPVLLDEFRRVPELKLHVLALRNNVRQNHVFERGGVSFHVLKVPPMVRAPSFFFVDTIVLKRELQRIQPDLVHAWGTERGAALVASRLGYPYLVTIQGLLTWYRELIPFNTYDRFATLLEQVGLRRARFATTESTFAASYLRQRYPQLAVIQAEHAPNPLFFQVRRRPQTAPVRFIAVGTLDYRKGSDLVMRSLNALTPEFSFELLVIGGSGGAIINSLRPELSAEFWRRVTFKVNLSPGEVAEELSTATVKVMPTRADTSPNAVKESVVAGVPVVASRIGGIQDYVFPGRNGILFPSGNLSELVDSLRSAVNHPLFGRGQVDASCLSETREYLSPVKMKQRFLEAYHAVLLRQRGTK
jgi:glycosyltransferase involved in cell wall biosynthesis